MTHTIVRVWHGDHLTRKVRISYCYDAVLANHLYEAHLVGAEKDNEHESWDHMVLFDSLGQIVRESA